MRLPVDLIRYYELQKRLAVSAKSKFSRGGDEPTCQIPELDPYDASIRKYLSRPDPLQCKQVQWDLTYLDPSGILRVNETAMRLSGYSDLDCSARCFDHNTGIDDDSVKFGEWVKLEASLSIGCPFVEVRWCLLVGFGRLTELRFQVNCVRQFLRVSVYTYHFANISRPSKPLFYVDDDPAKPKDANPEPLSILVLGIDSMSKSNMIRQMPLTHSYILRNMSGNVFDRHTKIGDNTWVNILAMLTGLRAVPTAEFPADLSQVEDQFFDDYAPYIWRNFSRRGYYTLFSEDRPDIQDFNYGVRKGFKRRQFDYYDRPYWTQSWASFVRKRSTGFCYNTVSEHKIQLDYFRRFAIEHHKEKAFGFSWWQSLSHDFLNTIGLADADTAEFLHSVQPYLNRTILFVISDHGHRYDSIRQSVIGRMEARLPYLAVIIPDWFRHRYPKAARNLEYNAKNRLTSQFDVFGTFVDILENVSTAVVCLASITGVLLWTSAPPLPPRLSLGGPTVLQLQICHLSCLGLGLGELGP